MSIPCRTKHRISRPRSIGYHFLSTSSNSYVFSDPPCAGSSPAHPSNTWIGSMSCRTKSEDFNSMYTSAGEVHLSGEEEGRIQEASYRSYKPKSAMLSGRSRSTLGDEKLSFGNTAPYPTMVDLIFASSSGKANFGPSLSSLPSSASLSSPSLSSSDSVLPVGLHDPQGVSSVKNLAG